MMAVTVAVQDLRVGMFIHLDLGWMAHPFPLSSFKLSSAEQIETIQGLGLKSLRWCPERSEADPQTGEDAAQASSTPVSGLPQPASADTPQAARTEAQRSCESQEAALRLCERQYGEACRDLRRLTERVGPEPEQARDSAIALTRALLDKMLVDGELCVRVLAEPVGDRASSHAMNVTIVSLLLARAMGMVEAELSELGTGALLHDIGKLMLPDRVRLPRDDYSAAEQALYRDHVAQGVGQGRRMGLSSGALLVLAQHHEMADGSGFPMGVRLGAMAGGARIVAMVNLYDNLCNAALPSRSLTPHEALSRMFAHSRNKFDAAILGAFIRLMGIYPPGSLVQLSDDRFGMVISVNAARPLKPRVQVYDPGQLPARALHLNLEDLPGLGIRRSVKAEQLPAGASEALAPRMRVAYFFDVEPVQAAADVAEAT